MSHSCAFCESSKSRRALRDLITQSPNMTTTRAARELNINRNYAQTTRKRMDGLGCIPSRTIQGAEQGRMERAAREAIKDVVTTGGSPIAATMPGDVEALRECFRRPPSAKGFSWPIGTCHYGPETRRDA